jgi:hypothetical protein
LQVFCKFQKLLEKKSEIIAKKESKDAHVNEGKFFLSIDVLFAFNCFKS